MHGKPDVSKIIVKKVTGQIDHDRVMRLVRELAVDAASYPERNILIDYRDTTIADKSMVDIMKISAEIQSYQSFFSNRVATVIPPETKRYSIATNMKACLVIMGFQYEVFTDYEAARAWLKRS